jgi:DNA-directed RNA polymerase specialized sigma24 family protein
MRTVSLRDEVDALAGLNRAYDVPELRRIARSVARRVGAGNDLADDLLGEYAVDLLTGLREEQRPLASLENPIALEGAVWNRMRQLAVAKRPRWNLVRALRRQVAVALQELPPAPASPPGTLQVGEAGRLSQARVGEAVAWLLSQPEGPSRAVGALSKSLLDIYFPQVEQERTAEPGPRAGSTDPQTVARRRVDVDRLLGEMRVALPPEKIAVLRLWAAGHTYAAIAEHFGIGIATAHAWLQQATDYLRREVARKSLSFGTVRALLMAELASRSLSLPDPTSPRFSRDLLWKPVPSRQDPPVRNTGQEQQ